LMLTDDQSAQAATSIRRRAIDLLARREHSCLELRNKLSIKFADAEESSLDEIIDQLICEKLLDDYRFTEVFVHSKIAKGFGPIYIRNSLSRKGIKPDLIDQLLPNDQQFWVDCLRNVFRKRYSRVDFSGAYTRGIPSKELMRIKRYCQGRGFTSSQLFCALEDQQRVTQES